MASKPRSSNALLDAVSRATISDRAASPLNMEEEARSAGKRTSVREKKATRSSGRVGMRLIAGHFDPAVARQLKLLAAEEDTTVQALLAEALDLLFVKKGKGRLAALARQATE